MKLDNRSAAETGGDSVTKSVRKTSVESEFTPWAWRDLDQIGTHQGLSPEGDARYNLRRNCTGRYGGVLEIWVAPDKCVTYTVSCVHKTWQKALAALLARARSDKPQGGG